MKRTRRAVLGTLAMVASTGHAASPSDDVFCGDGGTWGLYQAFVEHFVEADGRVVDHTGGGHSTSEGQAYAMVHALVAGDRSTFDRVLDWMRRNLAQGDLTTRLPGWKWGKAEDGSWRLLDENAASDADLWAGYALLQGARLWRDPALREEGLGLLALVLERELVALDGLGPTLLPGPVGFQLEEGVTRLNPSYVPVQVMRGLASSGAPGPWGEVATASTRLVVQSSAHGFVPDWVGHRTGEGLFNDPVMGPIGSYDAIRTYLWAGMLHDDDPDKATLATHLRGPLKFWRRHGRVPERVDVQLGVGFERAGNVGFLAALLPEVVQLDRRDEPAALRQAIEAQRGAGGLYGDPPAYYEHNLLLFALGHADGRYRFTADGTLQPRWSVPCDEATP